MTNLHSKQCQTWLTCLEIIELAANMDQPPTCNQRIIRYIMGVETGDLDSAQQKS